VKRLRHKLQGTLSDLGLEPQHLLDHSSYLHKTMPIGATAHQRERSGSAPIGHRVSLISCVRPMIWTTCTSWI
jgi:hypothetical protein